MKNLLQEELHEIKRTLDKEKRLQEGRLRQRTEINGRTRRISSTPEKIEEIKEKILFIKNLLTKIK